MTSEKCSMTNNQLPINEQLPNVQNKKIWKLKIKNLIKIRN